MQNQTDELQRQNKYRSVQEVDHSQGWQHASCQVPHRRQPDLIVKKNSSIKDVYYKFTLQMTDVETGEVTWMDEKEIVSRPSADSRRHHMAHFKKSASLLAAAIVLSMPWLPSARVRAAISLR